MRSSLVGPSGNHSPSKPQQNREDKGAERSSSSQPPGANPPKEKQKAPSAAQPPTQLTPLEQAALDVRERIQFLVAYAEEHGVDLNELVKNDEVLKKYEANRDSLKLRAPSPEGDDLSFLFFLFFFSLNLSFYFHFETS